MQRENNHETHLKKVGFFIPQKWTYIDKFIYKQAIDKMKDILTLYQSMQESAVDCLVLNKFHRNGNNNIDCTKYQILYGDIG